MPDPSRSIERFTVGVNLGGCDTPGTKCRQIASDEFDLLADPRLKGQYEQGQAALRIESADGWLAEHRTARKRALRADRLGYTVSTFEPCDWHEDIMAVNLSTPRRQGRPMNDSYTNKERSTSKIGPMACPLHHRLEYGVFRDEHLYGYAGIIRCGELAHVSMFLGHWDMLEDGIMYLLMREVVFAETELSSPIVLYYNRYDSGTDGLRFYKDRIGLAETDIEWMPAT